MLHIIVEHFLNKEGQARFSKWVLETRKVLKDFEGFIEINELEDVENNNRSVLLLKFENYSLLRKWSRSNDHEKVLKKIRPHMKKKQKSQIFKILK